MRCVSVVIADRHPVVLCGLKSLLEAEHGFKVVASCCDGEACIQAIRDLLPDMALLDIAMPGLAGLDILAKATSERLPTRVVLLTEAAEYRDIIIAAARGAYGVVLKDALPAVIVRCLQQVLAGQKVFPLSNAEASRGQESAVGSTVGSAGCDGVLTVLTERERQVVHLVSEGLSNKEIGRRLSISDGTTKVHLHHIYQKLAISSRTALAALALSHHDEVTPDNHLPLTA